MTKKLYWLGNVLNTTLLVICILSFSLRLSAQNKIYATLDSFYTSQGTQKLLTGNVLIAQNDSVIYKKSLGYQNIEKSIPNNDSSAFAMASVTKIFTATAILQLKEKGLLRLDDAFAAYFPAFPYPDITIRQLLSHTSGLPAYELFEKLSIENPDKIFMNEDVIPALKQWDKPLANKPGEGWSYSSMNYCLLALLVEKVSGLTLNDYFRKYIFEPADMKHSYEENYLAIQHNANRTVNYEEASNGKLTDVNNIQADRMIVYNCGGFTGQGGLITTTADMLNFDKAYFSGKLLTKESMEEAMSPAIASLNGRQGYGLGWFAINHPMLGRLVMHTGGRPGISTIYVHDLTKNQAVIILQNTKNKTNLEIMAITTLEMLNGLPVTH